MWVCAPVHVHSHLRRLLHSCFRTGGRHTHRLCRGCGCPQVDGTYTVHIGTDLQKSTDCPQLSKVLGMSVIFILTWQKCVMADSVHGSTKCLQSWSKNLYVNRSLLWTLTSPYTHTHTRRTLEKMSFYFSQPANSTRE